MLQPILEAHPDFCGEDLTAKDDAWWNDRCRRFISADAAQIWAKLEKLVGAYKTACPEMWATYTDQQGNTKLKIDATHATVSVLLAENRLSDPDDFDMYFYVGDDKHGLPRYLTHRGTTQLENFWKIQERIFTSPNTSPQTIQAALVDFVLLWNLLKRSKHNQGRALCTFDIGLVDEIVRSEKRLMGAKAERATAAFPHWEPLPHVRMDLSCGDLSHTHANFRTAGCAKCKNCNETCQARAAMFGCAKCKNFLCADCYKLPRVEQLTTFGFDGAHMCSTAIEQVREAGIDDTEAEAISRRLGITRSYMARKSKLPMPIKAISTHAARALYDHLAPGYWPYDREAGRRVEPTTHAHVRRMDLAGLANKWNEKVIDAWQRKLTVIKIDRPGGADYAELPVSDIPLQDAITLHDHALRKADKCAMQNQVDAAYPGGLRAWNELSSLLSRRRLASAPAAMVEFDPRLRGDSTTPVGTRPPGQAPPPPIPEVGRL